jgi:hypothetical protein
MAFEPVRYNPGVRRALVVGLAGAVAFLLMHPEMLGRDGSPRFPGWDVTRVFWADLAFAHRAVAGGELPLWNPWDRTGYSFVAEPQSACFDPVTWLLVAIALLIGSAPAWLITLKSVLYYGIAAAGIDAYLRRRRLPEWATALGTLAFVACPRLDKLKDQSALWPTAWAGWLLLALWRAIERPDRRAGVWLGLAVSAMALAGYPPTVFRIGLLAGPLALAWAIAAARRAQDRRTYLRALGRTFGVAAAIAVGLGAAQTWATISVLPLTERAALPLGEVLATRVRPEHAVGFLAGGADQSAAMVYSGLAVAIGVVAAVVRVRGVETAVLVGVAVFGFLLACGPTTPLLPALAELPGFRSFRIPAHYLVLGSVAFAVLAPAGLFALADAPPARRWAVAGIVGVPSILALLAAPEVDGLGIAARLGIAAAIVGLCAAPASRRPVFGWLIVALTFADLYRAGRPVAQLLEPHPSAERVEILRALAPDPAAFRIADFGWADDRPGPRAGLRDLVGHRPALTDRRYRMIYEEAPESPALLRAMNVELVALRRRPRFAGSDAAHWERPHRHVWRIEAPWPLASWVPGATPEDGPAAVLERLRRGDAPQAFVERTDLPDGIPRAAADDRAHAPARLVAMGANALELEVDAPAAGLLVVAEGYDPGWRAAVDGAGAPVLRANLIQRAIPVPAGTHRVTLRYAPPGVTALIALFLGVLAGAVVFLAWPRKAA